MQKHEACYQLNLLIKEKQTMLELAQNDFKTLDSKQFRSDTKNDERRTYTNRRIKALMDALEALDIAASALTK